MTTIRCLMTLQLLKVSGLNAVCHSFAAIQQMYTRNYAAPFAMDSHHGNLPFDQHNSRSNLEYKTSRGLPSIVLLLGI
jgi:hypothetical protein